MNIRLGKSLVVFVLAGSSTFLSAQSMTQKDPTHRPAPMYSKAEKKRMAKFRMVHGIVKDEREIP